MLVMVPLVLRSSILGVHELGGCAVTGGYSIMFWYICDAWMHLVVVVYWLLKESASAGSSDGSVSLGPGSVAIWNEYGGSGRQYRSILAVGTPGVSNDACTVACTGGIKGVSNDTCAVGIKEPEVVRGMSSDSAGLVSAALVLMVALLKAWLVLLSCVYRLKAGLVCLSCMYGLAACWRC